MNKINRHIYLICITFFIGFTNAFADVQPVTFTTREEHLYFNYYDSIGNGHPSDLRKGSSRFFIGSPTLFIQADKNQIFYLVYPGESIIVEKIEDNSLKLTINNDSIRNNELQFFKTLVEKTGIIYGVYSLTKYIRKQNNVEQIYALENQIEKKRRERLSLLKSYASTYTISPYFRSFAINAIECASVNSLLTLYWFNSEKLKKSGLYDKLVNQCINQINKINYSPFPPYLLTCTLSMNVNFDKYNYEDLQDSEEFKSKFDFIEVHFKRLAKYFLLSKLMFIALDSEIKIPEMYMQKYRVECLNSGYRGIISAKLKEKEVFNSIKGTDYLLLTNGQIKNIETVISGYKNELLYIDFWASWCRPCREEMPDSKKLESLYQNKNLKFIYVSIDKSISDWARACKEESIDESKSFLLLNSDSSLFKKQNKISTIPRYMLIDKNGQVISSDAFRPGNAKLKELINNYLN